MMSGIVLTALGTKELDGQRGGNLEGLYDLQLTQDLPREEDARQHEIHRKVQTFVTQDSQERWCWVVALGKLCWRSRALSIIKTAVHPKWKPFVGVPAVEELERKHQMKAITAL